MSTRIINEDPVSTLLEGDNLYVDGDRGSKIIDVIDFLLQIDTRYLDSSGRFLISKLPSTFAGGLTYKGTAAGNAVPSTSTALGDYYVISEAGTSQSITWAIGDNAIYNGSSGNWTKIMRAATSGLSVDAYGAVGNGSTDDSDAIDAAYAAAGPGDTVTFTPGKTYKTTRQITIPTDYITTIGYGAIITSATESQYQKFKFAGRTRGSIRGLRFDCLYSAATTGLAAGTVEISNSTDIDIIDCEFNDIAKNGIFINGSSSRVLIQGNRFYRNFCAIHSDNDVSNQPTYITIRGNHIRTGLSAPSVSFSGAIKMSGIGTSSSVAGHIITGNVIDTPGEMGIELQTEVNDCTISGNSIKGSAFGISLSVVRRIAVNNNTVNNVTYAGIEVAAASSDIAINGNVVRTNETSAITVVSGSVNVAINGGALYGVKYSGVFFQDGAGLSIAGVVFSGFDSALYIQGGHDVAISGCVHDSTLATTPFAFINIDAVDNPVYGIVATGNRLYGARSCIVGISTPNASVARDILVADNSLVNATCSIAGFSISDVTKALRIVNRNNLGWGTIADFAKNINLALYSTSSSLAWPYDYMFYERGIISIDATAGNKTAQLPAPATVGPGYIATFRKADSSGNTVTVNRNSAETIDGATSVVLGSQFKRVTVLCDGTNWVVIDSN